MVAQIFSFTLISNHAVVETTNATRFVPGTYVVFFTCRNGGETHGHQVRASLFGHLLLIHFI